MYLGVFSKTYNARNLEEVCRGMRLDGLLWTQFNLQSAGLESLPQAVSDENLQLIQDTFARYSIRPVALSGTFNMIDPDEDARKNACAQFSLQCRIARELGIPIVTLCTGSRHPQSKWKWHEENHSAAAWSALMRSTETILKYAQINGVCLGVEPEVNNIICSPEKAREYLDAVGSERLRIVMDGANLFRVEQLAKMRETLQEAFVLLGRDIVLAHAKDITYKKGMEFVAPGKGVLDYKTYFALLKQYSYKGPVIMHGLSEQQVPQSAQFLQRFMDTA